MGTSRTSLIPRTALLQRTQASVQGFVAKNWKPIVKGTLQGFFNLHLRSGLIINGCCLHEKNGGRWISLPSLLWTKDDGTTTYADIIDFRDPEIKTPFLNSAKAALEQLLAEQRVQG